MAKTTVGTHKLRTVQQSKSFLAHQLDGLPAELVEYADCLALLTFIIYIAHTDKRQEKIGKRRKVARCSERTAVVDDRHHIVIEKVEDALYGNHLHTAMPQRKRMCLEQHHQLNDDRTYLLAHAASMALDKVLLQDAHFVLRYILTTQRAEPGSYSIQSSADSTVFLSR